MRIPFPLSSSSRRDFLRSTGCGFGSLALNAMLQESTAAESDAKPAETSALGEKRPHFPARAKRIIFLFMSGGPSQMDLYDYKPRLARGSGTTLPYKLPATEATVGMDTRVYSALF